MNSFTLATRLGPPYRNSVAARCSGREGDPLSAVFY